MKSVVPRCWSERCTASDPRVCVSVLPIVSQRFPFLHGDETGRRPQLSLSFPMNVLAERTCRSRAGRDLPDGTRCAGALVAGLGVKPRIRHAGSPRRMATQFCPRLALRQATICVRWATRTPRGLSCRPPCFERVQLPSSTRGSVARVEQFLVLLVLVLRGCPVLIGDNLSFRVRAVLADRHEGR